MPQAITPVYTPRPTSTVRLLLLVLVALVTSAVIGAASASAAGLSPDSFGVNSGVQTIKGQLGPSDLALASASGVGVLRDEVIQGTNADPIVALAATAISASPRCLVSLRPSRLLRQRPRWRST